MVIPGCKQPRAVQYLVAVQEQASAFQLPQSLIKLLALLKSVGDPPKVTNQIAAIDINFSGSG